MKKSRKILLILGLLFSFSCSSSYDRLSNIKSEPFNEFSKHLFNEYKKKANFEANQMHDWDSAKLYSDKALQAINNNKIYPEEINSWKISNNISFKLNKSFNNLMAIYEKALIIDPYNLAKAISSLDCWSEQLEENWQTWDIIKCRDDYLDAMHTIYLNLKKEEQRKIENKINKNEVTKKNKSSIITKDKNKKIIHIVYFDFDHAILSSVNIKEINNFIKLNKEDIENFIIVGHTDTVGTKEYNQELSLKRSEAVKTILIKNGIQNKNIKIFGKGENDLSIKTEDEIPHPANRRAEIRPLN